MNDLGLYRIGVTLYRSLSKTYMEDLDIIHIDDGWVGEGANNMIDYYNPFALLFDCLIYNL